MWSLKRSLQSIPAPRLVSLVLAACALVATGALLLSARTPNDQILPGVTCGGVPVGGLTRAEAAGVLRSRLRPLTQRRIDLVCGKIRQTYTVGELGIDLDIAHMVQDAYAQGRQGAFYEQWLARLPGRRTRAEVSIRFCFDHDRLTRVLKSLAPKVARPASDAYAYEKDGAVRVVSGSWGTALDIEASRGKIQEALASDQPPREIALAIRAVRPRVTYDDLRQLDAVLSRYSTRYRSYQRNRTHNLKLAAAKLDRVLWPPGQVLSYNETVGERLARYGFRSAPIFSDGEVVPEIGGGICQVASTLYNAALLAGLEVVERRNHSRPVDYVPRGRDATVYWKKKDLRLRNNLKHPIYLRTKVKDGRVEVCLLGRSSDRVEVTLVRVRDTTIAPKVYRRLDPAIPAGMEQVEKPGRTGWRTELVRVVKQEGRVIRKDHLRSSYYPPAPRVVRIGAGPVDLPPGSAPAAAAVADDTPESPPVVEVPTVEDVGPE